MWVPWQGSAVVLQSVGEVFDGSAADWGQVIVVRGPSGAGRSAVLQQVYEWVAARQWNPPYWPPVLDPPQQTPRRAVVEARDVMFPVQVIPAAGAILPWLWWGLDGRAGCAVWDGREQIRWHGQPLKDAIDAADAAVRARVGVAIDAAVLLAGLVPGGGAAVETAKNVIGGVDNLALGTTLPGRAREAFTPAATRFDRALRADPGRRFTATPAHVEDVKDDARLIAAVATVVPVIVAVDDADGLDEISIAFLDTLVRANSAGRVLLVLGINTDYHPTPPGVMYTRIENEAADHNPELHWMLSGLDAQHRVTTIDLPAFTTTESTHLAQVLLGQPPGSSPREETNRVLAEVLAAADGCPGRLATLLAHRAVRVAVTSGTDLPDLRSLIPRSATREALAALPEAERIALARVALAGDRVPSSFLPPDIVTIAVTSGWARFTGSSADSAAQILSFASRTLFETVRAAIPTGLTPDEIASYRDELIATLLPLIRPDTGPAEVPVEVVLSILDNLTDHGRRPQQLPAPLLAAWLRLRTAAGLETATQQVLNDIAATATSELLTATAEALFDLGAINRPLDLFTVELRRLEAKYGVDDPRTWSQIHNLAAAFAAAARLTPEAARRIPLYEKAITLYQRLIPMYVAAHQRASSRRLPDTRMDLALVWDAVGNSREALRAGSPATAEHASLLGAEHPATLITRSNLASWRGEAGDAAGAAAAFGELQPIMARVLGADHPDTLTTRNNLASCRGEAGDAAGAAAAFEELLPIRARVLGADHPDTLTTRSNLAFWRGKARDPAR